MEALLESNIRPRKWVATRGDLDHNPIILELFSGPSKPPCPLKLNHHWFKDLSFHQAIKDVWQFFDPSIGSSPLI